MPEYMLQKHLISSISINSGDGNLSFILSSVHLPGGKEQTGASRFVCVPIKLCMHPASLLWYGWDIKKRKRWVSIT